MDNPLISILIPAYNVADYISQCLESVVNQTYKHLQVVIIDDGSTDDTYKIAKSYEEKVPFVEVYSQSNKGVASTRNELLLKAKGDFILFVDSDDWIELDMIECMLNTYTSSNADIVACGFWKNTEQKSFRCPLVDTTTNLNGQENIIREFLIHNKLNGSLANKLIPYQLVSGIKFRDNIWYGEDCLFFWQVINKKIDKVILISDCLYHYRMNITSISHEQFNYKKMSGHKVWETIYNDTKKSFPNLSDFALSSFAISDMWLLYYAALSGYRYNDYIRIYQKNVKNNFALIKKTKLINRKKIFVCLMLAYCYRFSSLMLKFIK